MKKALIIIDVQNDYFPGGRFELKNTSNTLNNIKKVLTYARNNSYSIFHVQHIAPENAPFFAKGSIGSELYHEITPLTGEHIIQKNYPNSFFKTDLKNILDKEDIKDIIICGMMTHMCIDSTTRGALELGLNCTLIEDCCTTKDLEYDTNIISWDNVHNSFISALTRFSKVVKTETFLK